ncbi:hypothetical protein [Fredinandcohnia sp. FSL W7-1320]|uniref:hypothetical protein n=1 Tax=Fredinandcohnia sp. FSL W7-1320 TaxID=2954540 RepID=UPI0030FD2B30
MDGIGTTMLSGYMKKRAGHIDANSFFEMPLPRNFILPYVGVTFKSKCYLNIGQTLGFILL